MERQAVASARRNTLGPRHRCPPVLAQAAACSASCVETGKKWKDASRRGLLGKALAWVCWSPSSCYLTVGRPLPLWASLSPSVKWTQAPLILKSYK